jgi:hypothetical protein
MAKVQKMEHLQGQKPEGCEGYLSSDHHHATRILKTGYLKWQDLFDVTREAAPATFAPSLMPMSVAVKSSPLQAGVQGRFPNSYPSLFPVG